MNKKNGKPLYLSAVQVEKRFNIFRTALAACVAILFCFFLILLSSKAPGKDIITFLTAPLSSFSVTPECRNTLPVVNTPSGTSTVPPPLSAHSSMALFMAHALFTVVSLGTAP